MTIGGFWLYPVILCAGVPIDVACHPQTIQQGYVSAAACERARLAILRSFPRAYAVWDK